MTLTTFRRWWIATRIRRRLRLDPRPPLAMRKASREMREAMHEAMISFGRTLGASPMSPGKWQRPVPVGAHHALWEDVHTFVPGGKPRRDPYAGLCNGEPPMSLRCPICEADQAPMRHSGEDRRCVYCGLTLRAFGTRIFWWREPTAVTVEWRGLGFSEGGR